jgi:hypothetical protein
MLLKAFHPIDRNGALYFAQFQLNPIDGSSEKVNKLKTPIK